MAYLVYPGATHTRFDHSLGVFHQAGRVAKKIGGISQADQRLIRLAALLHDIGHGPFSHVSEPILHEHSASELKLGEKQQVHELIGIKIIQDDVHLRGLITDRDRLNIVKLLSGNYSFTVLKEIVSGPLDADKQDYLLRDSYFCGVSYGRYDLERLLNIVDVHDDGKDKFLAIRKDGVQVLEQLLLARYYMTKQVYRHKIRLITDEMIGRAISLGINVDHIRWLKDLYSFDGSSDFISEYLTWNDERLVSRILGENTETYAFSLFNRLAERKLLKCIFDVSAKDLADLDSRTLVFSDISPNGMNLTQFKRRLESLIAERWNFDPNLVICSLVKFKSAVKTESEVLVLDGINKPSLFRDESTIFNTVNQSIQEAMFQVYAPVTYEDERDKRRKFSEFSSEITEMIQKLAGEPASQTSDNPAAEEIGVTP